MSKVIELIDRFFQSFINEAEPYGFYLGMADYVKTVQQTPEAIPIVKALEKQRLTEYEKLRKIEELCVKEYYY